MDGTVVKKLIARYGERELVESSVEEMQRFIVDRRRPDFDGRDILCIKFLQSDNESMEYAEESSWFINPAYVKGFTMFNRILDIDDSLLEEEGDRCYSYVDAKEFLSSDDVDDDVAMEFASTFGYSPNESYGPKMAAEFLPEILVLQPNYPNNCMLEEYQRFYSELLKYSLTAISHEEKLNLFLKYLRISKYCEKAKVVPEYLESKAN